MGWRVHIKKLVMAPYCKSHENTRLDFKAITINWINDLKSIRLNSIHMLYLGRKIRRLSLRGYYGSNESEGFR